MKNFTKVIGIIALLAVVGFIMTACEEASGGGGGGGGGGKKTALEGKWLYSSSSTNEVLSFSGKDVTVIKDSDYYKGSFTLTEEGASKEITMNYSSFSADGGKTWVNKDKYPEAKAKVNYIALGNTEAQWNNLTDQAKQLFISGITAPPASEAGTYRLENSDTELFITYTDSPERKYVKLLPINQPSADSLTRDTWKDGHIHNDTPNKEVWYKFNVTSGTTYYIWWDGAGGTTSNPYGSTWKTLNIKASAYYENGIPLFTEINNGWTSTGTPFSSRTFTANATTIVYIKVSPNSSGDIGSFGITYTTGTTRPVVLFNPPNPVALTADKWETGKITNDMDGEAYFSFNGIAQTTYYIWWNEGGSYGNGTKTLNIVVTAYKNDGNKYPIFDAVNSGWSSPSSVSVTADGMVYLKVAPYSSSDTGTFSIVYSETDTKPDIDLSLEYSDAASLTDKQWKDGSITDSDIREEWYKFDVTDGTTYRLWLNAGGGNDYGDGTKDLQYANINAWYENGTSIFSSSQRPWGTAANFTANATTTVYVRVSSGTVYPTGTFSLAYNSTDANRPLNLPATIVPLEAGKWTEGEITTDIPGSALWYKIVPESNGTYYIWLNESGSYGDNTKTLNAAMNIYNEDGSFAGTGSAGSAWSYAYEFTASTGNTVYIRVYPYSTGSTGTFGLAYTVNNTKPLNTPADTPTLTENQWMDGNLASSLDYAWYKIEIPQAGNYYIWLNESGVSNNDPLGDGSKSASVNLDCYYPDGSVIGSHNFGSAWLTPLTINVTEATAIYARISVYNQSSYYTGTFALVYSSANIRPFNPVNAATLTTGTWANGEIDANNRVIWFKFDATSGTTYRIWSNLAGSKGNNTKTLTDMFMYIIYSDGTSAITGSTPYDTDLWTYARSIAATKTGTIYIMVTARSSSDNGTFGVALTTGASSTKPTP